MQVVLYNGGKMVVVVVVVVVAVAAACSLSLLNVFIFQAEELDERKVQIVPPGFHVVFLPFADDFRKLKLDEQMPRGKLLRLYYF